MRSKVVKKEDIRDRFRDGQTLMVGGFIGCGVPVNLVKLVLDTGIKGLTLITNTTGFTGEKLGTLISNRRVKKVIASHIGTNRETSQQMNAGELEVELIPQGTLIEGIRSQGAGLGGFLTPTGIGTVVEKGKEKIEVNGREYLLELPIRADIALINAWKADRSGNLIYRYAARNFNPVMATAADLVLVEAEEIVPIGALEPNEIMTAGIFVDYVVDFS